MKVLDSAPAARTMVQSPLSWSDTHDWKQDFMNIERVAPAEIARLRAEQDRVKAIARQIRDETAATAGATA